MPPALRLANAHITMKTILRSTAAIALLGAATAAGTYPTDAEACSIFEGTLQCEMITEEAACNADTRCEWGAPDYDDTGEEECSTTDAFEMPMTYSMMNATAALTPQAEICSQFDEDECSGSCAYGMLVLGGGDYDDGRKKFRKLLQDDGLTCFVSPAKAQSLLIADGADPFIKGFLGYAFAAGFTCPFETTEAACTAISGCEWGVSDYADAGADATCYASGPAAMLIVNNKCQGSLTDTLVDYYEFQSGEEKTIAEIYEWAGVTDESSPTALAAAADAKVEAAEEATEAAESKLETLISASGDLTDEEEAKAKLLAAAAIAGLEVKKVVATIDAASDEAACADGLSDAGLTAENAACTATAARRRALLADYSTEIIIDPTKVDAEAAAAAVTQLETAVGADNVAATDENPLVEMETIESLDTTELATFKTSATAAGDANVEAAAYEAEAEETVGSGASFTAASALATAAALAAAAVFA